MSLTLSRSGRAVPARHVPNDVEAYLVARTHALVQAGAHAIAPFEFWTDLLTEWQDAAQAGLVDPVVCDQALACLRDRANS